jgi:hypothetical protein
MTAAVAAAVEPVSPSGIDSKQQLRPFYILVHVTIKGDADDGRSNDRFEECPHRGDLIDAYIYREIVARQKMCRTHVCDSLPKGEWKRCDGKSTGPDYDAELDCECLNPNLKIRVAIDRFETKNDRDTAHRMAQWMCDWYQQNVYIPSDGWGAELMFWTFDFEPCELAAAVSAAAADPSAGCKRGSGDSDDGKGDSKRRKLK